MAGYDTERVVEAQRTLELIKGQVPNKTLNECYKTIQQLEHKIVELKQMIARRTSRVSFLEHQLKFYKGETDE